MQLNSYLVESSCIKLYQLSISYEDGMNRITRVWYQIQHIDSAGITFSQGQILLEQKYAASTESQSHSPGILESHIWIAANYHGFLMFACAAARRAIGTRNGEQLT